MTASFEGIFHEITYTGYMYCAKMNKPYEEYPHSDIALLIDVDIPCMQRPSLFLRASHV